MAGRLRVLFLCTGNSCRSQMAEGWLWHLGGDRYDVNSAATRPAGLHPLAVRAMAESGVDISRHTSDSVDTFRHEPFDWVITVCDRARESCPVFPGAGQRLHWSFDDPAQAQGADEGRTPAFRLVRDQIRERIEELVSGR